MLKNKRLLAGPYLFWAVSFVVIPLLVIVYYAFTSDEGAFTFSNLAQITTPENLKALGMSVLLSFLSTAICLILAYPLAMILSQKQVKPDQFYCVDLYPAYVDEFSPPYTGMADTSGKERRYQQCAEFPSSAGTGDHQHTVCHYPGYGVQLPAFYGTAYLQRADQDRQ